MDLMLHEAQKHEKRRHVCLPCASSFLSKKGYEAHCHRKTHGLMMDTMDRLLYSLRDKVDLHGLDIDPKRFRKWWDARGIPEELRNARWRNVLVVHDLDCIRMAKKARPLGLAVSAPGNRFQVHDAPMSGIEAGLVDNPNPNPHQETAQNAALEVLTASSSQQGEVFRAGALFMADQYEALSPDSRLLWENLLSPNEPSTNAVDAALEPMAEAPEIEDVTAPMGTVPPLPSQFLSSDGLENFLNDLCGPYVPNGTLELQQDADFVHSLMAELSSTNTAGGALIPIPEATEREEVMTTEQIGTAASGGRGPTGNDQAGFAGIPSNGNSLQQTGNALTLTTHGLVSRLTVTPVCTELTRQPRHRHAV